MGRLIDADELIELIDNYIKASNQMDRSASFIDGMKEGYYRIRSRILNIPSEPSEIVHCRDCRHYYFTDNRIPEEQMYVCDIGDEIWQPNDYCSYGERREDSNESKERS